MSTPTLDLQQKQTTDLQQMQRLMMLPGMQQALNLLQMPVMELAPLVEAHLTQNPVIELSDEADDEEIERLEDDNAEEEEDEDSPVETAIRFADDDFEVLKRLDQDFRENWMEGNAVPQKRTAEEERQRTFAEQSISEQPTLCEHLTAQAHDSFEDPVDLKIAEILIGYIDDHGFLQTPITDIAALHRFAETDIRRILDVIKTFDPQGIAASNLQESLLIQLRNRSENSRIAEEIVEKHYDDLLHNRIPAIQRALRCTKEGLADAMHQIAKLDLRPGTTYSRQLPQTIIPDVVIRQDGEDLSIKVNDDFLPPIKINERYLKLLKDNTLAADEKHYMEHQIASAKWLLRNLQQRNDTLQRIVQVLVKKHSKFFAETDGQLVPMTMKQVSEELELHESTIARAVANKYIDCPRGVLPLRNFFSAAYTTETGSEISSNAVRDIMYEIIKKEDKHHPLSDEAISAELKQRGIPCARRTVAKYRSELNLGNTQQRRKF